VSGAKAIRVASLIWGASILASRLIGLVREAVIGRVLGGGSQADVFWTAFVIPDFLNFMLAGGALSLVFIPLYAAHLGRGATEEGERSFSVIANTVTLLLLVGLGALYVSAPYLVTIIAPGFDALQAERLVRLTRIILPAQAFHVIGGLLGAVLQARDKHTLPALAPLFYTGSIVLGGLIGQSDEGFAWGVLVGSILGPFGLPLIGALKLGLRWRLHLDLSHPDLRTWFWRSLPIMLGFSIIAVDDWLIRRQGSLLEPGTISTLQYAKTLMKVPMGVFGLATGVAAFPTLARLISEGRAAEAQTTLTSALRTMLVLTFAAQVALTLAGGPIAGLLYGARLDPSQHLQIGFALAIFGCGLWAWAAQTLVARGFYAQGLTWLPTAIGSGVVLLAFPLYPMFAHQLGALGLPLASTIAISTYVLILLLLLRRTMGGPPLQLAGFFARNVLAAALAILLGVGIRWPFGWEATGLLPVSGAAIAATISSLAFLALSHRFGVPEVKQVVGLVRRRLPGRLK
jgi:putative peptidoglycan lipid II flippase